MNSRQGLAVTNPLWQPHKDYAREVALAMTLFTRVDHPFVTILTVEKFDDGWKWHAVAMLIDQENKKIDLGEHGLDVIQRVAKAAARLLRGVGEGNLEYTATTDSIQLFRALTGPERAKAESSVASPVMTTLPHKRKR